MERTATQLRADAERIWWAGVRAVQPAVLIPEVAQLEGESLIVGDEVINLREVRRLAIVGAGKASGGMTVALEQVLGERLLKEKSVTGWVNVPADCVVPTRCIHLHGARPAGVNEPRPEGVAGTERILKIVSSLGPDDACICLISGGGSALLPAPVAGITLDDKIRVAKVLSAAGANIAQLNTVRTQLSRVKGGGLARACRAGRLITLIISDVLGDPLDLIASGPTVGSLTKPGDALDVLNDLRLADHPKLKSVLQFLKQQAIAEYVQRKPTTRMTYLVIGNNAAAVDAAGCEAESLGYSHAMIVASTLEVPAEEGGRHLAEMAVRMRTERGPDCLISGGEPTVKLVVENGTRQRRSQPAAGSCRPDGTRGLRGRRLALRRHGWRRRSHRRRRCHCHRGSRRPRGTAD